MKKYYVIILCLLFIAGVTSCATKQDRKSAPTADSLAVEALEEPADPVMIVEDFVENKEGGRTPSLNF